MLQQKKYADYADYAIKTEGTWSNPSKQKQ
jgi:hypothetical protein